MDYRPIARGADHDQRHEQWAGNPHELLGDRIRDVLGERGDLVENVELIQASEDELFEGHPAVNLGLDGGKPGFLVGDRRPGCLKPHLHRLARVFVDGRAKPAWLCDRQRRASSAWSKRSTR